MVEKRKFFEVEIPLVGYRMNVLSTNEDLLPGKIIKLDLTKTLKGRNAEGTVVIEKKDNKLVGRFTEIKILPAFIRRMIRKGTSYVEDSFKCKNIVLKPYMLTRKTVHRSVRAALRSETKKFLCEYVDKLESEDVFQDIISGKLQKNLSLHLKKIYPLSFCEIRIAKEIRK
jgi:ribosomal protein S3AE